MVAATMSSDSNVETYYQMKFFFSIQVLDHVKLVNGYSFDIDTRLDYLQNSVAATGNTTVTVSSLDDDKPDIIWLFTLVDNAQSVGLRYK